MHFGFPGTEIQRESPKSYWHVAIIPRAAGPIAVSPCLRCGVALAGIREHSREELRPSGKKRGWVGGKRENFTNLRKNLPSLIPIKEMRTKKPPAPHQPTLDKVMSWISHAAPAAGPAARDTIIPRAAGPIAVSPCLRCGVALAVSGSQPAPI